MGRIKNDGRGRLGGRTVGTKNKPKQPVGEWVDTLLNKHRSTIEKSLSVPTDETGGPILAALLVVSALNRTTEALGVAASTAVPQETNTAAV